MDAMLPYTPRLSLKVDSGKNGSKPITTTCCASPGPVECLSTLNGGKLYGAIRRMALLGCIFDRHSPDIYPGIANRGSGGGSGSYACHYPSVSERVQSGLFPILTSSYVYHHVAQAQQNMKYVAYLGSKFSLSKYCAFSLFFAELAVQFRIPNRSVPFHCAWWRKHLWALWRLLLGIF